MTHTPTAEERERFATQKAAVLDCLRSGATLTQTQALRRFGIMRLASRINDLKNDGWLIARTMAPEGARARVAWYCLEETAPRQRLLFDPQDPEVLSSCR
jgi:hypothetical protein